MYAYYERTAPMFGNVLRDAELVDFARDAVAPLNEFVDEAAEILAAGRAARGAPAAPHGRGAPARPRLLHLALAVEQRHQATRCREAQRRFGGDCPRMNTELDLTKYRALSFDCYGTLIDWETGIAAVLAPWAREHGLELSDEELLIAYGDNEAAVERETPSALYPDVLATAFRRTGDGARRAGERRVGRAARRLGSRLAGVPGLRRRARRGWPSTTS